MNKGITSKQVEEALGIEGQSIATVSEFMRLHPTPRGVERQRICEVVIDGDVDVSMAHLQALIALFGTVHVCGKYTDGGSHTEGNDPSTFYFEVSE